jgi:hypothetical protein
VRQDVRFRRAVVPTSGEDLPTLLETLPDCREDLPALLKTLPDCREDLPPLLETLPHCREDLPPLLKTLPDCREDLPALLKPGFRVRRVRAGVVTRARGPALQRPRGTVVRLVVRTLPPFPQRAWSPPSSDWRGGHSRRTLDFGGMRSVQQRPDRSSRPGMLMITRLNHGMRQVERCGAVHRTKRRITLCASSLRRKTA